jgi:1,2-diacylglycerol 3-alpha-glucosyltransferase
MSRRLVILTEIISPYRIPLFNAMARNSKVDLHLIFLAETDPGLRDWQVPKTEIRFSYEVLRSWRKRGWKFSVLLNAGVARALRAANPEVVLCGGYNYVASWQALMWARRHQVPFFLWSESNSQDMRRGHVPVEFLKRKFLSRCSGFVVPGRSAREYLREHKIADDSIFTAPNAVDNDFYAAAAQPARAHAAKRREELGLPSRYFLFAGRLVKEKGVFELLSAYAKLEAPIREQIGLVFAGDGVCRAALEREAASISRGMVRFVGFAQREALAALYALAEALILPTYSDTWGLVVNEGMACGLPVILSHAAGCAADLVDEGWNGLLVAPRDADALTSAMRSFAQRPEMSTTMGTNSQARIAKYSPEAWVEGIAGMMASGKAKRG